MGGWGWGVGGWEGVRGTHYVRVMGRLCGIDPPFSRRRIWPYVVRGAQTRHVGVPCALASLARYFGLGRTARMGPLRSPHGLFMGCLQFLNPYGACKLIMHALKLYGPVRRGKICTSPYGARARVQALWVDVWFFCSKQPGNSPGVWCDWDISNISSFFRAEKTLGKTAFQFAPTDWGGRVKGLYIREHWKITICHVANFSLVLNLLQF